MKNLILYLATKRYRDYEPLFKSRLHYFYPSIPKVFHTLTDELNDPLSDNHTYIKDLPWPLISLLRFHFIKDAINKNKDCDYTFYFDSECKFYNIINDRMRSDKIVVVRHHQWLLYPDPNLYTHKRGCPKNSQAYFENPDLYFNAGILGGPSDKLIEACDILIDWINKDLSNHIIPQWHDETYWNKFCHVYRDKIDILPQGYNIESQIAEEFDKVETPMIGTWFDKEIEDSVETAKKLEE